MSAFEYSVIIRTTGKAKEKYQALQDENLSLQDELSALREQLAKLQAQNSDKE